MRLADESELDLLRAPVPPPVTKREFRECRNAIVRTLARFGSVGPTGVVNDDDNEAERFGGIDANFYIIDDQYNDSDRIHFLEVEPKWITEPVLDALGATLSKYSGWCAHIALGDSALDVFADRVVTGGRRFWDCDTVHSLEQRCSGPIVFGKSPPMWPEAYAIFRDLICDEWSTRELPPAPDRQWWYSLDLIRQDRRPSQFTFSGAVTHVLHPSTRLELVTRFLDEFASGIERSLTGIEVAIADAGRLLVVAEAPEAAALLDRLTTVQTHLSGGETFHFWARVIYGAQKVSDYPKPARSRIEERLLRLTDATSADAIRLSALNGLATFGNGDAVALAKQMSFEHWDWPAAILEWLQRVEKGYGQLLNDGFLEALNAHALANGIGIDRRQ